MNGVVVDFLKGFALGIGAETGIASGIPIGAFEREQHIIGGEIRAIMEFHALTELELPGVVVDRLPRLGEPWDHLLIVGPLYKASEDVPEHAVVGPKIVKIRVDGRGFRPQADGDVGGLHGASQQRTGCGV